MAQDGVQGAIWEALATWRGTRKRTRSSVSNTPGTLAKARGGGFSTLRETATPSLDYAAQNISRDALDFALDFAFAEGFRKGSQTEPKLN